MKDKAKSLRIPKSRNILRKVMESEVAQSNESYSDSVKMLFEKFVPTLELLFARKLPKDKRKEIEEKLSKLRVPSIQYAKCVEKLKATGDMTQFAKISNELINELLPDTLPALSGIEYVKETLFKPARVGIAYIGKSKYSDYLKCIEEIVSTVLSQDMKKANSYLSSVDNVETDNLAWAQPLALDMGKTVKYLTPDRKRFSVRLAMRCVTEYGKMSGIYERLIKIIAGFVSIKSDSVVDYSEFRKKSLSYNLGVIKDKGWAILAQEFDVLIRNSIAHKSYVFDPSTRVANFSDPISQRAESISYQVLFEKTRELSCLVLALSQFKGIVCGAMLSNINSYLVQNKVI